MKLKAFAVFLVVPLLLSSNLFSYVYDCANDEPPCDDSIDCCTAENAGANPVNLYRASLSRKVTDLRTYGAAPVEFTRIYQSRTLTFNGAYWDFGMNEGWQHNWNFEMRQLSSKTHGFFDIKLRYPNGWERNFKATDVTGVELAPTAGSGDRLQRWPGSPIGYTLVRADGSQYDFLRYLSPKFDLKEVRNGLGFKWIVTHDVNHKVKRITNNFGRWIEIERGLVGGAEVITKVKSDDAREVTFGYTTWSPTGEQALTSATYPAGEQAAYTWVGADSLTTGRPLLGTADDPMYGGAGARTKYAYNYDFIFDFGAGPYLVTGIIKEERNLVTDDVIISLPGGAGQHPEIREGNGTEITRKFTNARMTESRDGEGRITTYTYDTGGFGFRSTIVGANGGTTTYARDYAGRPLSITDALGNTESWTYNAAGFELTHTNKRSYTTTNTRDVNNRITRRDYPDGSYEEFTYNANGLILTHRLQNSGTTSTTYNATGNVATYTDGENHTWTYTYDASGQLATVMDPRSNTTSLSYDWRGQLLSVTHPDTTARTFEYDDYGNRTKITDELGKITEYTYNEYNRVSEIKDPLNRVTEYEYGREPGCSSCGFSALVTRLTLPSGKVTENTYDLSWRLLSRTAAPGTADEAVTTLAYNGAGDLVSITNPESQATTYTHDLLGRPLTVTDALSHTTTWTYDAEGNKLTEQLADSTVTSYEYDAMNRVVETTDALSQLTEYTYDASGNIATLKDARNNTYTFEHDRRDLRIKMIYPGGSYEQWTYDGARNKTVYRTRANETMTFTFDSRNRDTFCDWSGTVTPDVTRTYDAVGRTLTVDNANSELTYTYDDAGQLLSEEQKLLAPALTKTVSYTYNADGLRSKITYPDGKQFITSYTERNQPYEINFNFLTNPLVRYTYDLAGRRTKRELNNSTQTDYTYGACGLITSIEHANAGGVFDKREYGYNAVHNRTWEKRLGGLGDVFGYDSVQQLTSVSYDATNPDGTPSSPASIEGFTYDAVGNRTGPDPYNIVHSYTTNALNQYTHAGWYTYDANGNPLTIADHELEYDAANRLTRVYESGAGVVSLMKYDGRNRCISRTVDGVTTHYFFDGWNTIEEYNDSGIQLAATAHGVSTDEPVFRWSAGSILCYYSQDALGSVTQLTDTSGLVVETYSYDAFGTPKIIDAFNMERSPSFYGNRFMFSGREWYSEILFYDYRNRYYMPRIGRFVQTDPIRFSGGDVNLYRYVSNSPINANDPFGLAKTCATLADCGKIDLVTPISFKAGPPGDNPDARKLRDGLKRAPGQTGRAAKAAEAMGMFAWQVSGHPGQITAWWEVTFRCCVCDPESGTVKWSEKFDDMEYISSDPSGTGMNIYAVNTDEGAAEFGKDSKIAHAALTKRIVEKCAPAK